jgi:uncharacterized protein YndB with AHSA1/START domain
VADPKRVDAASRVIAAPRAAIYRALLDRNAISAWRPPSGMRAEIYTFDPHVGGVYRMAYHYIDTDHAVPGKTTAHADAFEGRFVELVPDSRVVEEVVFQSDDPAFANPMRITTRLDDAAGGTRVTISCENVPPGIKPEDHQAGITSTLNNLAVYFS